jgi:two-component system chemotaxis response regulator CheY
MISARRVLSVGQCGFDHGSIARTFRQHFGAEVTPAHAADDALTALRHGGFDLVLVNRILDGDGSAGLDVIRRLKADADLAQVPVMLVSNYADAQEEAVAAGAVPGFGKSSLGRPDMLQRVRGLLSS